MKPQNEQEQNGGYMVQRRRILNKHTNFAIQEAYKRLRTNLNFSIRGKKCKRFCITSAGAGEGKSITLLNLAISIAQTNKRVLLIDADMRRPAVARLLVEQASPGLSEVLCEEISAKDAIRKEVYPNLDILYSGEIPPNPSELVGSECMERLVNEMEQEYDYILIDTPPVGVVTDACLVATLLDGVLMLVWQNRTRKDNIKAAVESLQLAGANILGYVMNGVEIETKKYYYSNY